MGGFPSFSLNLSTLASPTTRTPPRLLLETRQREAAISINMSNAQDLLSILNNANAASRSSLRPPGSTSGIVETSILDFKSGKMNATFKPNGKYLVEPDMRRGELHVVYCSSSSSSSNAAAIGTTSDIVPRPPPATLKLEWRDRRTRTTVDTYALDANSTFERVETGRGGDRVYLLQRSGRRRSFFW